MAHKKMFAIGALAGFLIGAAVCFATIVYYTGFRIKEFYANSFISEIGVKVLTLRNIRNGKPEAAIKVLENHLDNNIAALPSLFESDPKSSKSYVKNTIAYTKKYREQYPWKNENPEIEKAVTAAFSKEYPD